MVSGETEADRVMFENALTSPAIPRVYVNGFVLAQSFNDVAIVAQTNGTPTLVVNMSFTSAKSLAIELQKVIERFEVEMNHKILTMDDIRDRQDAEIEEG